MNENIGAVVSTFVGLLCASGGVVARPRTPSADNRTRTIGTAALAAAPVLGWILFLGHPLATSASFLAATLVAGELRDLRLRIAARRSAAERLGPARETPCEAEEEPLSEVRQLL